MQRMYLMYVVVGGKLKVLTSPPNPSTKGWFPKGRESTLPVKQHWVGIKPGTFGPQSNTDSQVCICMVLYSQDYYSWSLKGLFSIVFWASTYVRCGRHHLQQGVMMRYTVILMTIILQWYGQHGCFKVRKVTGSLAAYSQGHGQYLDSHNLWP